MGCLAWLDVHGNTVKTTGHEIPVNDGYEGVEDVGDVAGHVVAELHRDLPCRPGRVVAHADVLRVQVARQDWHELCGDEK